MLFYVLLASIVVIFFFLSKYERRRLLYIHWMRLTHYEFWPTSVFYFPAFIYYLFLCLPYRSLGLLSIVNPGTPAEDTYQCPKVVELTKLANNDYSYIARFCSLPHQQKQQWLSIIKNFIKQQNIKFPLVIKPQMGLRGADINMVRNLKQLKEVLIKISAATDDYMVQEYVTGGEYGVLYFRLPNARRGQVISVGYKEPVCITGNGKDSLRHLILSHKRACLLFHIHFNVHRERLTEILPAGEVMRLNPLGTHSRGAIFRAANHLISKKLTSRIDRISQNYPGFYLGRYDIISKDKERIKQGEGFKIIELNGLFGEPVDLYDPANSIWQGYKMLFDYFRLAVKIAAANLAAGHQPLSWRDFLHTSIHAYRTLR